MGRASRLKRERRELPTGERVVLWGVLKDGQMGNYLFPTMRDARGAALNLRAEHPDALLEYGQVGVVLLTRSPLPAPGKGIEVARSMPIDLEKIPPAPAG